MSKFPYYKGLDGVRGIAVLMVIFYHSRLLPIGWVGVQVFFVLSGFLITGILLTQTGKPFATFLRQFYWRRGLRIWPLYFLYFAICAVAYFVVAVPENWRSAWPTVATFTYNIAIISPHFQNSDYLGHFWTLCVEEQFYLIWPFLVFALPLKGFRRCVLIVVLAGPVIRLLTAMLFAAHFDSAYYVQRAVHNLPTSHLDAFACGALLAVTPLEIRQRLAPIATPIFVLVASITVIAGLVQAWCLRAHGLPAHWLALGYDDLEHFHQNVWAYSLLNLTGATLILCVTENTPLSRLLSFRPLAFIGMISYGIYVWHLPLMRVAIGIWPAGQHSAAGLLRFVVYLAFTIGVAAASYFCFERYFLRMKRRPTELQQTDSGTSSNPLASNQEPVVPSPTGQSFE